MTATRAVSPSSVRPPEPAAAGRLALRKLTVSNFRSYASASLELSPQPVVLVGPNGAGKTNLLEAVSFLAPGRGLRRARAGEMQRRIDDVPVDVPWAVAARLQGPDGEVGLGTGADPEAAAGADPANAGRRVVRIDGAPARAQSALAELLSVVWLTPQMDRLFVEGPGARRRFLDRLVFGFDPAHAGRVTAFEQAMRQRNRLLTQARPGGPSDAGWLGALEAQMAERAVAIAAARRDLIARLGAACAEGVGPFPRAALRVDGLLESWLDEQAAVEAEDRYAAELATARATDAESGSCAAGPHRSDLSVTWRDRGMLAAEGSTGEQKALLIAIVLAHARLLTAERGAPPVLLLDEVNAHLDADRRGALADEISALGVQAWLTGTDRALFEAMEGRAQIYAIAESEPHRLGDRQ